MIAALVEPFATVLRARQARLEELGLPRLLLVIAAGGGIYGAALGLWRSPLLALYVALKVPLLLIVTSAITLLFNWTAATLLGLRLPFAHAARLTFLVLAVAAVVLGSLAPVAWLFTLAAPLPGLDARATHNVLLLVHTALIAVAGLTGAATMRALLGHACTAPAVARRVYAVWLASFALVGGQVAWLLRPFVGSIYFPVAFLRADSFQRNVYEFLLTDVLPYLMRGHR